MSGREMNDAEMNDAEMNEAIASEAEMSTAGPGNPGTVAAGLAAAGGPAGLERRYRRLLSAYPRDHRAAHAEEMAGVLMAGAREGQTRPGARESANLVSGAVRIRLQRTGRALGSTQWRDALAVVSVLAPLIMLAMLLESTRPLPLMFFLRGQSPLFPFWSMLLLAGWVMVTAFVLLRMRRSAAVAAAAALVVEVLLFAIRGSAAGWSVVVGGYAPVSFFLGTLSLVAILRSAGPRRGLEILGRRRTVLIVAALLAWVALHQAAGIVSISSMPATLLMTRYASLVEVAVGVPVAVRCVRNPVGGRVALLACPAVSPHGAVSLIAIATRVASPTLARGFPRLGAEGGLFAPARYVISPALTVWALYLVLSVVVVGFALGARAVGRPPAPAPA